ncbi:MAG: molybdopterin oxidoreductase [Bdellovibrionales bacterium]|nr:molybdopterin oxidoreductase [Bdellovibrionales bacterium]
MATHTSPGHAPAPGQFTMTQKFNTVIWSCIFVGLVLVAVGLNMDRVRTAASLSVAFFFFFNLALGGLFFAALQHVVKAGGSVTVRRVAESFTAFLPWAILIGAVVIALGWDQLWIWLNTDLAHSDHLIHKKAAYLNPKFFMIRCLAFAALWMLFRKLLVGRSLLQDKTGDVGITAKQVGVSVVFLLTFAFSYSFFSVDFVMSMDPHWFSTMFGVYTFAGLFQSTMAFFILMTIYLMKRGMLDGLVNENHIHDIGKLMFAFTVFMAYIAFSQFMLIWYANLPEETVFYLTRAEGSWFYVSFALLIFKFIVPFFLLLPREAKRNLGHVSRVAVLILAAQYMDLYWLVYPNFYKRGVIFGFYEVGGFILILGLFLMAVTRFWGKHSLVAIKDPRMHEALNHHI